jgi:signal peptidase II
MSESPTVPQVREAQAALERGAPLRSARAWTILLIVTVLSVVVDLGSKHLAFERVAQGPVVVQRDEVMRVKREIDPRAITEQLIPSHPPRVVVPGVLNFTLVLNPGAVFGVGPGQRAFFVTFTMVALSFAMFMFAKWTTARDAWAHTALGLLIGGGLGNLYDRLQYACVRDFIHPLPGVNWPFGWAPLGTREVWPYVSNLADLFLLIGILMLLRHLWRRDGEGAGERARG